MKKVLIIILIVFTLALTACNSNNRVDSDDVLTLKEMKKISKVLERKRNDKNPETIDDGAIYGFLGQYKNAYVILISSGGGIPEGKNYTVGGYSFWEPMPVLITVYCRGNIYSFKEAYEKRKISIDDVRDVYDKYGKMNFYHYPIYSSNKECQEYTLYSQGYSYYMNIKEIPYLLVANEDFSEVCYLYYSEDGYKRYFVSIYDEQSLLTTEQIMILSKHIPILKNNK